MSASAGASAAGWFLAAMTTSIAQYYSADISRFIRPVLACVFFRLSIVVLDGKYAKWSSKYAEIHVFSGCEQIHSKYTVKYTG